MQILVVLARSLPLCQKHPATNILEQTPRNKVSDTHFQGLKDAVEVDGIVVKGNVYLGLTGTIHIIRREPGRPGTWYDRFTIVNIQTLVNPSVAVLMMGDHGYIFWPKP